ncbi:MAG TPA: RNA polymerase sigma-70 factor [Bacteroidetes bacterium]|nr:RNA polymerase sigma-70 factor [Bacteroidota bacterium]
MSSESRKQVFDQVEFKRIFLEYGEQIRNFIYYKSGNLALAEDIMQDTFLKLWTEGDKVSPEKVKSFLYTVANNRFLDGARHQQVVLKFEKIPQKEGHNESPEHVLEQKEFKRALEKAIESLPETQREVFLMNRIEKLTYREIAERLAISVKAVEKRMHKALGQMRKLTKKI